MLLSGALPICAYAQATTLIVNKTWETEKLNVLEVVDISRPLHFLFLLKYEMNDYNRAG